MTIRRQEQPDPSPEQSSAAARRRDEDRGNVIPLRQHRPAPQPAPAADRPAVEPLWREVVGRQLRAERTARAERIADVAQRAGVAPQYLSELERGVKDASSEILSAVAGALGLSVLDLARRAGTRALTGPRHGPVCLAA
jgi:hypothetical protein